MSYSELYLQPRSRPPLPLIALAAVIVIGSFGFFLSNNSNTTQASKKTLQQHEIVNINVNQAGIFWQADQADIGWIIYGDSPLRLNQIALDETDSNSSKSKKLLHYSLIKNLQEDKTYYYKIVSDNELIGAANNEPFLLKTIKKQTSNLSLQPAYGKVIQSNGQPAQNVFVMLRYKNAYPLLAKTGPSGEWLMPLQVIIDKSSQSIVTVGEKDSALLEMMNDNAKSHIESLITRLSPLPQTVMIGKDYTFSDDDQVLPAFTERDPAEVEHAIAIRYPKEGAVIPGSRPLINGVGVPGKTVTVNINSAPIFSAMTKVDDKGDWRVDIPNSILPGTYRLTLTTEDNRGRKVGLVRRFSLAKSGEAVVLGETATPSGTLRPSPTPTRSTVVIATSPTASPTAMLTATPTLTPFPTITLAPVITEDPNAHPTPPVTGVSIIPYIITGFALLIMGAGLVLVF